MLKVVLNKESKSIVMFNLGDDIKSAGFTKKSKESLSTKAFQTIVAHSLGACDLAGRERDSMGIDATCSFGWKDKNEKRNYVDFNVQIKGTSRNIDIVDFNGRKCWKFSVESLQLEKYRALTATNLIFVLAVFPPDSEYEKWVEISSENLLLKIDLYWVRTQDSGNKGSYVFVPTENRLTQESIWRQIVLPMSEGRK